MFQLKDKTVLLISPEKWGPMKVSKHHYALELANAGSKVFFIEPPSLQQRGIQIVACPDHPGISLIQYKPVFRGKRFLPSVLYAVLLRLQIKQILKVIGKKPDLVLCFHGYLFENLRWFGATKTIFFAADQFYYDALPPEVQSADLLLAVSDTIRKRMEESGRKVWQMNHGLQETFVALAKEQLNKGIHTAPVKQVVAGYIGNLRMQALDRKRMMEVIGGHPGIRFIFWGSYRTEDLNLGGESNEEANAFIRFLETSPNVELRGAVKSELLPQQMQECNLFWLCWKTTGNRLWDGSNSHKILEYMATGSPIVSHHVSSYDGTDLLYMLGKSEDAEQFATCFRRTVALVEKGESATIVNMRLQFAVNHAYHSQLQKIQQLLLNV